MIIKLDRKHIGNKNKKYLTQETRALSSKKTKLSMIN